MIQTAKRIIDQADAILVTAGAGMGVDSGLPDFRGDHGFWKAYPAIKKRNISFQEMANPDWFETAPEFAWAFYGHRLHLYRDTQPHYGYDLLLDMMDKKPGYNFVMTSNVDGQFQKAGFDEKRILEKHGSIHHLQCTKKCSDDIWSAEGIEIEIDIKQFKAVGKLPTCPKCGAIARPNILMFDDWQWNDTREQRQSMHYIDWKNQVVGQRMEVVVIEIGAGTSIPTIRNISEALGKFKFFDHIRINPTESQGIKGTISLPMGALEGLKQICKK